MTKSLQKSRKNGKRSIKGWILFFFIANMLSQGGLSVPSQSLIPESTSAYKMKVRFPFSWEITGSDFTQDGIATQSESYREIWTLEMTSNGKTYLISPRTVEPVYTIRMESVTKDPFTIFISPVSLAALLGLEESSRENLTLAEEESPLIMDDIIPLIFNPYSNSTQEHHIKLSKTKFYTVIFTMSR